ncbi:substrate-binding domain-containing protein [Streptomyces lydicamycinicus]|nr:substrate-binding domain-containing protein [Streptomyces lydicamycinicus]USA00073.1 substrate-binding domain-containing protein [Streptomyces lydicamycinicus]
MEWGRAAVDRVWPSRPDALICANDLIAAGALQRLRQLGADVPGRSPSPALTTSRSPASPTRR